MALKGQKSHLDSICYEFSRCFGIVYCSNFTLKSGWGNQVAYETIIGFMPRIVAASLIAFVCGQILNAYVFVKIKKITKGKHLWQRATGSSLVGDLVDTMIFTTIAFIGTISTMQFF
ncbi:inner membrane protein YhhQ [Methanobrevibacter cuticularis]|uniref:Queuosine precursor transporter n=1 Tax=Methanobrevibacter cuticularis TaxID=47311 RepID=A0A166E265_9EURY|nr:queuosine precursor transporter [Methanobrevibacter cuticularis]KZX16196.1 inner membrane protein YhhQ [Methanobrevibacter cuticularis]